MKKTAPTFQLLILLLLTMTAVANTEIYRVIDADGKVTFTDQPPANSNDLIETVPDADPKQNITPSPASLAENHPEWLKEAQENVPKRLKTNNVNNKANSNKTDKSGNAH